MGLYYQAFTGGAAGRGVAAEDILRRLRNVPVQAVIVGWSEDPALYRELGEALHRRGAELWLWFPVFSEHTLREGLRHQTGLLTGAPLGARVFDGDETFDFCCACWRNTTVILRDVPLTACFWTASGTPL